MRKSLGTIAVIFVAAIHLGPLAVPARAAGEGLTHTAIVPPGSDLFRVNLFEPRDGTHSWGARRGIHYAITAWDDTSGPHVVVTAHDSEYGALPADATTYNDHQTFTGTVTRLDLASDLSTAGLTASVPGLGEFVVDSGGFERSAWIGPSPVRGCGLGLTFGWTHAAFTGDLAELPPAGYASVDVAWGTRSGAPLLFNADVMSRCAIVGHDAAGASSVPFTVY